MSSASKPSTSSTRVFASEKTAATPQTTTSLQSPSNSQPPRHPQRWPLRQRQTGETALNRPPWWQRCHPLVALLPLPLVARMPLLLRTRRKREQGKRSRCRRKNKKPVRIPERKSPVSQKTSSSATTVLPSWMTTPPSPPSRSTAPHTELRLRFVRQLTDEPEPEQPPAGTTLAATASETPVR